MRQKLKVVSGKKTSGRAQEVVLVDGAGIPFDLSAGEGQFFPVLDLINGHNHTFSVAVLQDNWGHNSFPEPGFVVQGPLILGVGALRVDSIVSSGVPGPYIYPLPDDLDIRTSYVPLGGRNGNDKISLIAELNEPSFVPGEEDSGRCFFSRVDGSSWEVGDVIYLTGLIALRRSLVLV